MLWQLCVCVWWEGGVPHRSLFRDRRTGWWWGGGRLVGPCYKRWGGWGNFQGEGNWKVENETHLSRWCSSAAWLGVSGSLGLKTPKCSWNLDPGNRKTLFYQWITDIGWDFPLYEKQSGSKCQNICLFGLFLKQLDV